MKLYLYLFLSIFFIQCSDSKSAKDNKETMATNEATGEQKSLFDGTSMSGWRTYQNKKSDSWSVVDGTLYCKGSTEDKSDLRADIITEEQYENFDFSVDWKI